MRRRFGRFNLAFNPILVVAVLLSTGLVAAEDEPVQLAPIVVTPTRVEQFSFDLPTAVNVIDEVTIQDGRRGVNISETLVRVPETVVQNRKTIS